MHHSTHLPSSDRAACIPHVKNSPIGAGATMAACMPQIWLNNTDFWRSGANGLGKVYGDTKTCGNIG
ncbi:uncharacterized protein STEHIDRAFT_118453 [Stereum hirsutum FP-91666 SS1]|uniref:uncharacterized protein n=1 Tax=Stereum hirsutum (strain FP-91666) TaxID=721885 RepID=UPI00044101E3|nr:uncharacterized protein STEHIDRAFT_118453 [Stereum hirsutum FP-91666 SS1]EIM91374.1 hypothetical protein STEHIDRAFT_118453 [Stereum hirsutum FP-91666 SS1]